MGERIEIRSADGGRFEGYLASASRRPVAGLVVLPEVFNVNEHIRMVVDEYAADGFVVLAPDLYWRQEPGTYLPYSEAGLAKARQLWAQLDVDQFARDTGDIVDALRARPECNGKVGLLGYCLGGTIAYLAAAQHPVDAAVSYYGIRIDERLDLADRLACPVLMHFAENDAHVPAAAVARIAECAGVADRLSVHVYRGASHGFNRRGFPPYHEEAARLARERTLAHLRSLLA